MLTGGDPSVSVYYVPGLDKLAPVYKHMSVDELREACVKQLAQIAEVDNGPEFSNNTQMCETQRRNVCALALEQELESRIGALLYTGTAADFTYEELAKMRATAEEDLQQLAANPELFSEHPRRWHYDMQGQPWYRGSRDQFARQLRDLAPVLPREEYDALVAARKEKTGVFSDALDKLRARRVRGLDVYGRTLQTTAPAI